MGTEVVWRGRSPLARQPLLFCSSTEPRYDPDLAPSLRMEILSRQPNPLNHIHRYTPALRELADVPIRKNLTLGHSPARDQHAPRTKAADLAESHVDERCECDRTCAEGTRHPAKYEIFPNPLWLFATDADGWEHPKLPI